MYIPRHDADQISNGTRFALASFAQSASETDAQRDELTQARLRRKRRHARRQLIPTKIKVGWS